MKIKNCIKCDEAKKFSNTNAVGICCECMDKELIKIITTSNNMINANNEKL